MFLIALLHVPMFVHHPQGVSYDVCQTYKLINCKQLYMWINKGKTNEMQQMIVWQSVVPQHVSGVFTPIIRRADCKSLPMVFCPGCRCCGFGESGSEMCALWKGCCLGCCLTFAVVVSEIRVARCVHCEKDVARDVAWLSLLWFRRFG
jgi:hypothetical protein